MKTHSGWVTFAGIMLFIAGVLNVIYGIAAIGDSKFFIQDQKYILSNLNTWGWVTLLLGILQLVAAFSLWAGGLYGRALAILAASLSAVGRPAVPAGLSVLVAGDLRHRHHRHLPGGDVRRRGLRGRAEPRDPARCADGSTALDHQDASGTGPTRPARTRFGAESRPRSGVHPVGGATSA